MAFNFKWHKGFFRELHVGSPYTDGDVFTVEKDTGNTTVGGTLAVTGTQTFTGATTLAGTTVGTGSTLAVTDADSLTVNSIIVPQALEVAFYDVVGDAVDSSFFVANRAYQVAAVRYNHGTAAGAAANVQVQKLTGTTAVGSGTNLLTNNTNAGFDSNATANTVQTGTLTATTAELQLAAGDRLGIDFTGTHTSTADISVTIQLIAI